MTRMAAAAAAGHLCNRVQRRQSTNGHGRRAERDSSGARGGRAVYCH